MTETPPSSKPEVIVVQTTAEHIRELGKNLREKDRKEVENYGFSCAKALWRSYKRGLFNKTALIDGEVIACWGCAGVFLGDKGHPWLLTSNAVTKLSPLRFAKMYQREVYKMLQFFPVLENYVDAEYDEAVRLLSIIGFEIGEPEKHGKGTFRKFTMVRAK